MKLGLVDVLNKIQHVTLRYRHKIRIPEKSVLSLYLTFHKIFVILKCTSKRNIRIIFISLITYKSVFINSSLQTQVKQREIFIDVCCFLFLTVSFLSRSYECIMNASGTCTTINSLLNIPHVLSITRRKIRSRPEFGRAYLSYRVFVDPTRAKLKQTPTR